MKKIELPFTTLEIHDGYVVGQTKEGVHLTMDDHLQVVETLNQHLDSPYGLIIDEINSYSIDLPVMFHISKDKNICCIGVVYYRKSTKIALEVGKLVVKKPVYFSNNKNEVTTWVKEQVSH